MNSHWNAQRVTVMGLGHFGGGVGAVRWLHARGARLLVTDTKPASELQDALAAIADLTDRALGPSAVRLRLGGHDPADFSPEQCEVLVVSPAVPARARLVQMAREAGVRVTAEIELLLERLACRTVGITGSNGKSTTASLIAHMLTYAAQQPGSGIRRVWLGGNIGGSLLDHLAHIGPDDVCVLEISSFMLEAMDANAFAWSPHIAVITNLSPNHLDRHTTMDEYARCKRLLFAHQQAARADTTILNARCPVTCRWADDLPARLAWAPDPDAAGPADDDAAWRQRFTLPGQHNQANLDCALAAVRAVLGRQWPACRPGVLSSVARFRPLAHRLETVGSARGVSFVNDSKATTPEAAITALQSFAPGSLVLIAGGYDKQVDLAPLAGQMAERCTAVVLLGQVAPALDCLLASTPRFGAPIVRHIVASPGPEAMDLAVQTAASLAAAGQTVLLSPACASYGMFSHYEQRGERFRSAVQALPGFTAA